MAETEIKKICRDVRQKWPSVKHIAVHHRLGYVCPDPILLQLSINPCLVHGCAYIVAEPAGVFRNHSAEKLAAGSSSCSGAKNFVFKNVFIGRVCWSPHLAWQDF